MGCLGVHFALLEAEVLQLKAQTSDAERLNLLHEQIEEPYFAEHRDWLAESDKAWDAMHRALTDGELGWDNGTFPLNHVVLGGENLYEFDDYIMTLKTPAQVQAVAQELSTVTLESFREAYFRIDEHDYGCSVDESDYEYTWSWFQHVRQLYIRAAEAERWVLFTASQ